MPSRQTVRRLSSFAKVAVTTLIGGPLGGLAVAASETIDELRRRFTPADRSRFDASVKNVEEGLQRLAESERAGDNALEVAIANAETLFLKHRLSAAKLAALDFNSSAAAKAVLDRDASLFRDLSAAEESLCRKMVHAVFEAFLTEPDTLGELEPAFRQAVLAGLKEIDRLPELTAKALRAVAGDALLVDPTLVWPRDRFAPSALLRAAYAVVPFHGRAELRREIAAWCQSDRDVAVGLYTGPGGMGKTRLFMETCRVLGGQDWNAGFLDRSALDAPSWAFDSLLAGARPVFIVVDYAETQREPLIGLLRGMARAPESARIRLVLLARAAGDWWDELRRRGDGVGDLLTGPATMQRETPPLAVEEAERTEVFQGAVEVYADAQRLEAPAGVSADLSGPGFSAVLFVHMAALAALDGHVIADADALLDYVLKRESGFWDKGLEAEGLTQLSNAAILQAAALVTLAGGASDAEDARAIVAHAPLLADQPRVTQAKVVGLLRRSYPGERWLEGVQPDLLGEHLVAVALDEAPELLTAAVRESATATETQNALTVLNRLAQRRPECTRWLERALDSDLNRLAEPAMAVAIEGGDPVGVVLARVFAQHSDAEMAARLEGEVPKRTVALRELAFVVTATLHAHLRAQPELSDDMRIELARVSNNLGNRLSALGRREAALAATQEALDAYRELAADRPDAFKPDLAMALNNLGAMLSELGRREAALAATQEAVDTYQELAADRPDAFKSVLASALNNLGARLSELGRREEALAATQEAVDIRRELAADRPDAFKPDLAMALNNLGPRLSALGRREAALAATQEALHTYRELAADRPDAFKPDLAMALNNLGNRLSELGRREEALPASQEAVDIRRELAADRPDAFKPDLAMALNNLGGRLSDLGRREEALAATQEAVDTYRELAAARPDAFKPDLASALNNLGVMLSDLGRREEALAATQEAVDTYRAHAADRPDAFKPDLAMALNNVGLRLSQLGRHEAALAATEEAVDTYRELAADRPDAFKPGLASALNNLGGTLSELGRVEEALAATQEAVDAYRELAADRPDAFRANLATSIGTLTACLTALERHDEALTTIEEGIATLSAAFLALPDAFAQLMTHLVALYVGLAQNQDREPNNNLLQPILAKLAVLKEVANDQDDE